MGWRIQYHKAGEISLRWPLEMDNDGTFTKMCRLLRELALPVRVQLNLDALLDQPIQARQHGLYSPLHRTGDNELDVVNERTVLPQMVAQVDTLLQTKLGEGWIKKFPLLLSSVRSVYCTNGR